MNGHDTAFIFGSILSFNSLIIAFDTNIRLSCCNFLRIILAPSAPPSNVRLSALGVDSIMIYWDLPRQADRNGHIISSTIHYGISHSQNRTSISISANQQSYKLSLLQTFTLYAVTLTVETINGSGPASPVQQILTEQGSKLTLAK